MAEETRGITKDPEIIDGRALAQIEMETQRGMALQRPRNPAEAYEKALKELNAFPEFADEAYYTLVFNEGKNNQTIVEGPSIKASSAMVRCWGNCAVGARVTSQEEERIRIEGVFVDYETNVRFTNEIVVARVIKKRNGDIWRLSENQMVTAIQAGMSKAQRNASLKGLPAPMVRGYFQEAKRIAGGSKKKGAGKQKLAPKKQVEAMYELFHKLDVTKESLDEFTERMWPESKPAEIAANLKGIYNSIRDKQQTVTEVFGQKTSGDESTPPAPSQTSMEEIIGDDQLA